MASMALGGIDVLVGNLKPILTGFGKELVTQAWALLLTVVDCIPWSCCWVDMLSQFASRFDPKSIIDVRSVRAELEALLTEKLEFLTAARVKKVCCVLGFSLECGVMTTPNSEPHLRGTTCCCFPAH